MKKNIIVSGIVIALILTGTIFFIIINNKKMDDKHRVNMTIIRDDVSEYGLSVKFVNSSNEIIYFTSDIYSIQKMVSGEWSSLNTDDIETTTIATEQELGCSEEITININWKQKYGRLGGGEYRLVFPLNDESDTFELYDRFIIKEE